MRKVGGLRGGGRKDLKRGSRSRVEGRVSGPVYGRGAWLISELCRPVSLYSSLKS